MISEQLIKQCIAHDRKAQRELYVICYAHLYKVAKRYASNTDEIEEIITESFLKINNHIATVNNEATFIPWIKKIAVNTAINLYRAQKKYKDSVKLNASYSYEVFDNTSISYSEIDQTMDADYIVKMINQLPNLTKEIFNLYAIDGYTHKEISEILNIKEELSRWHLFSARKQLTTLLKQYNHQFIIQ